MNKFTSPVIKALDNYVYLYSHPVTNEIFYVGKGNGNRIFTQINDAKNDKKL